MEPILKKNIDRCMKCPFREPGCRQECYTGMEIDRRQRERKEHIKEEKNKESEYYGRNRERDTRFLRERKNGHR